MITKEPCCEGGTCYRLILGQEGWDDFLSVNPVGDGDSGSLYPAQEGTRLSR